jgi:hypothetical protein
MLPGSSAQKPEKLFRETRLIAIVLMLGAVFLLASFINFPLLAELAEQHYVVLK